MKKIMQNEEKRWYFSRTYFSEILNNKRFDEVDDNWRKNSWFFVSYLIWMVYQININDAKEIIFEKEPSNLTQS